VLATLPLLYAASLSAAYGTPSPSSATCAPCDAPCPRRSNAINRYFARSAGSDSCAIHDSHDCEIPCTNTIAGPCGLPVSTTLSRTPSAVVTLVKFSIFNTPCASPLPSSPPPQPASRPANAAPQVNLSASLRSMQSLLAPDRAQAVCACDTGSSIGTSTSQTSAMDNSGRTWQVLARVAIDNATSATPKGASTCRER